MPFYHYGICRRGPCHPPSPSLSGALLVVWCTNDPRVIAFAKSELVPKWGFEYVATWYWLKVGGY